MRWKNKNTCRWRVLLVISVPKIFLNGLFYFNLSSKTWSHVFLEHSAQYLERTLLLGLVVTSAWDLPLRRIKCCSVVFSVTLSLLVINTSSPSPVNNKRCRLPMASVTNLPWSGAAECLITPDGPTVDYTRWSHIFCENRDFCLPYLHFKPPLGGPRVNIGIRFRMEELEWCGYPIWWTNFKDRVSTFRLVSTEYTNVTDTQTDIRTDRQTLHDGIGRPYA